MFKNSKLGLLLALLMAGSIWFYVQRILVPYQQADAVAHGRPRGNLSDLYPRWLGARELLVNHRDPYSAEATHEIQRGYYGRAIDSNRPDDPKDEERFAYPVYVVFLLAPSISLPFEFVRVIFGWLLAFFTVASVWLWLRALRWKLSYMQIAIVAVLTAGSFAAVQGIKLQQLSLLVGFLIAVCAASLASGQLFLAGSLLAVATIKPQLVVLPAAWLIVWTLSGWRERQGFFWGFLGTGLLLAGAGEYVLPGWIPKFMWGLAAYNHYTGGHSLLDVLATPRGGGLLTIVFILATAALWWRLRRAPLNSPGFDLALAWTLAVTIVVAPMVAPYNQLLLLPAVFLVLRFWKNLWQRSALSRLFCAIAAIFVLWPWIASLALVMASLFLPAASVQRAWAVPLWSSLGIPLAVLGVLGLCINQSGELRKKDA